MTSGSVISVKTADKLASSDGALALSVDELVAVVWLGGAETGGLSCDEFPLCPAPFSTT
ncbi:MAG: hypothetical protein DHS20C04_24050 [Hyphococcus sp.]|nr:MAG: hypothetical protein DHS20C04_24050 [Marinicaulis sp.]